MLELERLHQFGSGCTLELDLPLVTLFEALRLLKCLLALSHLFLFQLQYHILEKAPMISTMQALIPKFFAYDVRLMLVLKGESESTLA